MKEFPKPLRIGGVNLKGMRPCHAFEYLLFAQIVTFISLPSTTR